MQTSNDSASIPPNGRGSYSKAFEQLVRSDHDLEGLLSYALYKQTIREAVAHGRPLRIPAHRDLTPTEIAVYRNVAQKRVALLAKMIVQTATPKIVESAVRAELRRVEANLAHRIDRATSWRPAVITNLAAWLLSILITFLIAIAGIPGWILALISKMKIG